jgi:hippurate hydrolase
VTYDRYYPATINDPDAAHEALEAAACVCRHTAIAPDPAFTSEDFAFMLQAKKGAYLWLGQARQKESRPLHHPEYDFNDDIIATGLNWYVTLAQRLLAA